MDAGNYTILARLGEGPLGAIYEGAHRQTQERVVVRLFPPALAKEPNILGRLLALQRALLRLEPERSLVLPLRNFSSSGSSSGDPSIAGIIECGRLAEGGLYVVSEFVTGESLATQLRRHAGLPLPNKALRLGRQLASSLAVAHAANIHHLALRPEKILLVQVPGTPETEHLKVLDLGLLNALGRVPRPEEVPTSALPYLAPEYRRGESSLFGQADVFALGVMLYEIGSGGLPASVRSAAFSETRTQEASGSLSTADAQTALMQMLPSWLQPFAELLDRMLAPVPGTRPTMAQVAATLQQLHALAPNPSSTSGGAISPLSARSGRTSALTPNILPAKPSAQSASSLREPPIPQTPTPSVPSEPEPPKAPTPPPEKLTEQATAHGAAHALPHDTEEVAPISAALLASAATPPYQPAAEMLPPKSEAVPLSSQETPRTPTPAAAPAPSQSTPLTPRATRSAGTPQMAAASAAPAPAPAPLPVAPNDKASAPAVVSPEPSAAPLELEIQAEYTLDPRRQPNFGMAFAPTHASAPGNTPAPSSGSLGGRTAATPVEPGLAGQAMLRVGQLVGNFRIVSKIGQGGMGAVYAAVHRQIGRRAAIKVLHGPLARTADYTARFLNEARAVNILRHPNLVEIFDFGQLPDGTLYIIMEFLEGESLRAKLRRTQKLTESCATELALQMGRALESAHQKGIVHRDLKPENVMLVADPMRPEEERVKILDFGIAKVTQAQQQSLPVDPDSQDFQTAIGTTMGTPKYMAPEQYGDASKVDGKADVFALGVILYEMVSGQVPFPKTSLSAFHQAPRKLIEVEPTVSPRLAALIHRMLTPKPADRPSMREVLEQLTPPPAPPPSLAVPPPPPPVPSSGHWGWLTLGFFVIVAGLLGAFAYKGWVGPPPPLPVEPTEQQQADLLIDTAGPKARALGVLYQGLRASDPALRAQAARALGQSRDVAQWSSIASLLKDPDPVVQAEAAEALGKLGASDAHAELLAMLDQNPPPGVRVTIAGALTRLIHPRGPELLHGLVHGADERIRLRAALLLLESGDTTATEPLRATLKQGSLPDDIVVHVLSRLAQTGDEKAQQQLAARMAGEGFGQRRISAAGQLARLGDERARALLKQGAERPGPQQLISALLLAMVGDTSGYTLFKNIAADASQPVEARQVAMDGLGACGRRQGALLLAGVLDETTAKPALRQVAAGAILQITGGDPNQIAKQSLSFAQAALGHDDWLVRQAATAVLGDLDSEQAVPLLTRALGDTQREVRSSAATALGQKTARSALYALRAALHDVEPEVRQAGLRAMVNLLGTLGAVGNRVTDAETRTRLQELVSTGSAEEQVVASATLLRLGDETQVERLRNGFSSPNPLLRKLVAETVPGDSGLLKEALRDSELPVRGTAARRLAALEQREAVPVLREMLGQGGADSLHAYALLRKLGEPVALPADFASLLGRDTPASLALLDVLFYLPLREALPLLNKASLDPTPQVRRHAAEVLASLYKKSPEPTLLSLLYHLSNDADIDVRTRTGALLSNLMRPNAAPKAEPPPDMSISAPVQDLGHAVDAAEATGPGTVRVMGEQWVRFQLDQQAGQSLGPVPAMLKVDAGRHVIWYAGGSLEVTVAPGQQAVAQIPLSYAEQLLGDASDALRRNEVARAQQNLDRARALISRGRGPRTAQGELLVLQARIFETQGRFEEAMKEIQSLLKLPEGSRRPEHTAGAQALQHRLSSRLGRIRIYKEGDGRCLLNETWVRPGEHQIDVGGGQAMVVRVREGAQVVIPLCKGGAP